MEVTTRWIGRPEQEQWNGDGGLVRDVVMDGVGVCSRIEPRE